MVSKQGKVPKHHPIFIT